MTLSEMLQAVSQAEAELSRADMTVNQLAKLLVGRLHKVNAWGVLEDLKRELRDFNIHTGKWNKK